MCGSAAAPASSHGTCAPSVPPCWQRLGYRSRAYLKLNELNQKLRLLRPGMRALELGSAPGSWTQVLVEHEIETLAIDLLPMAPVCAAAYAWHTCTVPQPPRRYGVGAWCVQVPGSRFLQGDFTTNETKAEMRRLLGGAPVDLHVDSAVPGGATAHCPGLLGWTLQGPSCVMLSGRAAEPPMAQWGGGGAAVRPGQSRRSCSLSRPGGSPADRPLAQPHGHARRGRGAADGDDRAGAAPR